LRKEAKKSFRDRDDLTGEHKFGDAGQALLAVIFGIVWLGDVFFLKRTTVLESFLPTTRAVIGIILLIFSGWLAMSTIAIVFGEERKIPQVIRKGAYRYCRHPMYLSEIILYLALLLIKPSVAAAIVLVVVIGFMYYLCRHEEKLLLNRFGDDYREYMQAVPMWLPRLFKRPL
jgi:protein-S-isoprenylcysteine O-methyltransferase Ste14